MLVPQAFWHREPDGMTEIAQHLGCAALRWAAFPAPGQPRHIPAGEGFPAVCRASDAGDVSPAPVALVDQTVTLPQEPPAQSTLSHSRQDLDHLNEGQP